MRAAAPTYDQLRLTIPAREALLAAGNIVEPDATDDASAPLWRVTLSGRIPRGLVADAVARTDPRGPQYGYETEWALRLADEPEYPGVCAALDMWTRAALSVACPHRGCRRALVWYEAGYVPGYRICTAGHHAQLNHDCSHAEPVR